MNTELETGKLYILSGIPASGKSSFLKASSIPLEMILSTDGMRQSMFGSIRYGTHSAPRNAGDEAIFEFIKKALTLRAKNKMTTFIDATNLSEGDRQSWAMIAIEEGMKSEVLFFKATPEEAIARDSMRVNRVGAPLINEMCASFDLATSLPSRIINPLERYRISNSNEIDSSIGIDAIGDVHGLKKPLLGLLQSLGYDTSCPDLPHPDGRKLMFLGDMVDRGPESIEVLQTVMDAVNKGGHYAVIGNHEIKLLGFLEAARIKNLRTWSSVASAKTGYAMLALPFEKRQPLVNFLRALPAFYTQDKVLFTHANIGHQFDPLLAFRSDCAYGMSGSFDQEPADSDELFRKNNRGRYILVRGHIPMTSAGPGVKTVYDNGEYGGDLVALRVPETSMMDFDTAAQEIENADLIRQPSNFNYDHLNSMSAFAKELRRLEKEKLVVSALDTAHGLRLYKYSKSVFFNNSWSQSEALLRARGLVLNLAGEIVQNTFTKVFNYQENGTTCHPETTVITSEKINGFMGAISLHPCDSSRLLVTTTGSFDSPFVSYIQEMIDKSKARYALTRCLQRRGNCTLLFEVVHPSDPHIVQYSQEEQGLYLIGGRGLSLNDLEFSEEVLDEWHQDLLKYGALIHRRTWVRQSFSEALEWVKRIHNHEGLIIREDTPDQKPIMKIKSPWYLTTKFISRMGPNNIKHMFENPNSFKQKIDEEFYPLVDNITSEFSLENYSEMTSAEKTGVVQMCINQDRSREARQNKLQ